MKASHRSLIRRAPVRQATYSLFQRTLIPPESQEQLIEYVPCPGAPSETNRLHDISLQRGWMWCERGVAIPLPSHLTRQTALSHGNNGPPVKSCESESSSIGYRGQWLQECIRLTRLEDGLTTYGIGTSIPRLSIHEPHRLYSTAICGVARALDAHIEADRLLSS